MTNPGTRPPATLVEALGLAAERAPARGIGLVDARGHRGARRSYPDLFASARLAARRLAAVGVEPRTPVLVCLPTSFEFLEVWFGAVLGGAWPLAVASPGGFGSSEFQLRKIDGVLGRLGAHRLVCGGALVDDARRLGLARTVDAAVTSDVLAATTPATSLRLPPSAPEDTAFLQLTSGSTGLPRAAMIPHRAAVHNPAAIVDAMEAPFDTPMSAWNATGVSWLPLYHDMGLVGSLLVSVLSGIDLWLLSPRTFLGRPATWLRSLGEFACTLAPAPNFAYQTCVERVRPAELDGTSLARWRCAMIGAEMIRPETTAAFAQAFAASGFPPESFRPCYGLAEATLAVTFDRRGEGVRTRTPPGDGSGAAAPSTVACVGAPVRDTEVRIRAPDGTWLAEGGTGEVCVRGPSVFAGYHGDPEATAECLLRDGWLRTGDLGFLDAGELWLTGRTKDLIIVNGQNVMPHEIEWLAESAVGGGGSTRSGAFALAGADGERAVLVVEVVEGGGADLPALAHEIRVRVGRALAVPLADLLFVRRGRIPKTTSGKVQRNELRRLYLAGAIERLPVGSS